VPGGLPLPTLLSQVLVAFTIELDNEFEQQMPHRTTRRSPGGSRGGPWLVSLVMWSNLMRFVGIDGVRVGELQDGGGNLAGMERWGYVVAAPDSADGRSKPPQRDWVVRATAKGRQAAALWPALLGVIERRWQERFGAEAVAELRESLQALAGRLAPGLPEYLPVAGYGLWATVPGAREPATGTIGDGARPGLALPALLSQVLLAFTIDFERESGVALAIGANVLRILGAQGIPIGDLPKRAGVSNEAISMSLGFLQKHDHVVVEPNPAGRGKLARLTRKGLAAQAAYDQLLGVIEKRWGARFGQDEIANLRRSLGRLVGEPTAQRSPLLAGLEPHPEGWRASVPRPDALPHHPMVLHRGGYPDGS
jgi:DNA-binding MarR family transcriptional regulator